VVAGARRLGCSADHRQAPLPAPVQVAAGEVLGAAVASPEAVARPEDPASAS
jgi:hypothetical protein